uniref:Chitin-binding type-2 domain-containing protein n=1 Tax=Magallana gigas TaxID=29159 RepID=A0A8W8JQM8_MAGGI
MHPCNCSLFRLLVVMCIVLHGIGKISVSGSDSCEVSPSTVQFVDICPDSEEKWKKAAARKNCSAFANQCSEPERFAYHCVINEYVNETLEVCAYTQFIFLGKCTGYSIEGNVIQQNSRTDCSILTHNPCPNAYNSDEAYRYPYCYQLTKKSTTVTRNLTFTTDRDTSGSIFTTPRFNVSSNTPVNMLGKEENTGNNISTQTIIIVTCAVLVSIVLVAVYLVFKRIRRKSQNENKEKEEERHNLNGMENHV